tara:strand:+ start:3928 stop:4215 length:288 start_codon:yes stop_codon:yes gene_type:complete
MSNDKKTPDVLKEIKFDNLETTTDTITVTADVQPLEGDVWTIHNSIVTGGLGADDVITVNTADLEQGSNGTKQLDLFEDYLDESKYVPIDPWNEQ